MVCDCQIQAGGTCACQSVPELQTISIRPTALERNEQDFGVAPARTSHSGLSFPSSCSFAFTLARLCSGEKASIVINKVIVVLARSIVRVRVGSLRIIVIRNAAGARVSCCQRPRETLVIGLDPGLMNQVDVLTFKTSCLRLADNAPLNCTYEIPCTSS
jgi:hypothetical protein